MRAGLFRRRARAAGCRDVMFVGTAVRPPLRSLRFDWLALRLLPRIVRAYRGGDDHLMSSVARIFEDYGFRMVAPHEVAPEILMPEGPLGSLRPSARDEADIARALALLDAIGPFDVGQAAVVANNHVLAVEAAEGTDAMLGAHRRHARAGPYRRAVGYRRSGEGTEDAAGPSLRSAGDRTAHGRGAARAGLAGSRSSPAQPSSPNRPRSALRPTARRSSSSGSPGEHGDGRDAQTFFWSQRRSPAMCSAAR